MHAHSKARIRSFGIRIPTVYLLLHAFVYTITTPFMCNACSSPSREYYFHQCRHPEHYALVKELRGSPCHQNQGSFSYLVVKNPRRRSAVFVSLDSRHIILSREFFLPSVLPSFRCMLHASVKMHPSNLLQRASFSLCSPLPSPAASVMAAASSAAFWARTCFFHMLA